MHNFTYKKRLLRKSKRHIKKRKTNKKYKLTKKTRHSRRKVKGGGKWTNVKTLPGDDICPICLNKFSETPNNAVYTTNCGHHIHNDCLEEVCKQKGEESPCPICRTPLSMDCMDVWAFKNKALGNPNKPDDAPLDDDEINKIYNEQP